MEYGTVRNYLPYSVPRKKFRTVIPYPTSFNYRTGTVRNFFRTVISYRTSDFIHVAKTLFRPWAVIWCQRWYITQWVIFDGANRHNLPNPESSGSEARRVQLPYAITAQVQLPYYVPGAYLVNVKFFQFAFFRLTIQCCFTENPGISIQYLVRYDCKHCFNNFIMFEMRIGIYQYSDDNLWQNFTT